MSLTVIAVALFLALVVCVEIGYRIGAKRIKSTANAHEGFGAIEGAVFGLFGLLLSLSFFGAASRLDARRQLIVQAANAIASAYMRVDLLPSAEQAGRAVGRKHAAPAGGPIYPSRHASARWPISERRQRMPVLGNVLSGSGRTSAPQVRGGRELAGIPSS